MSLFIRGLIAGLILITAHAARGARIDLTQVAENLDEAFRRAIPSEFRRDGGDRQLEVWGEHEVILPPVGLVPAPELKRFWDVILGAPFRNGTKLHLAAAILNVRRPTPAEAALLPQIESFGQSNLCRESLDE